MEVQATARYIRQSPRKVRLVIDLIRGLSVEAAQDQLAMLPKRASVTVLKLLKSAAANAKHNRQLEIENLYIARAFVDQGPTIKRFRPKAFGRAGAIRKRTSHVTIVLAEKVVKSEKPVKEKEEVKETVAKKKTTIVKKPKSLKVKEDKKK